MTQAASQRALYFRLGDDTLAVGEGLRQVVTVDSLTRVPRVSPELVGLFSVRGEVLPLIDLRPLVGQAVTSTGLAGRQAALLEHHNNRIALLLDEVLGFFPVQESGGVSSPKLEPLTRFRTAHGTLSAAVLDPGKLMAALERQLVLV